MRDTMPDLLRPWLTHYDAGVPPTLAYPDVPLDALLDEAAHRWPDRAALIYAETTLSYAQLKVLTDTWAAALAGLGMQPGDRVALLLPNLPQFVIGFFGALKAGVVAVPLNPAYKESELAFYLALTGARCLLTQTAALPMLENVLLQTQVTRLIVTEPSDAHQLAHRAHRPAPFPTAANPLEFLDLLAWQAGAHRPAVAISPDDAALLAATGGTTGTAKVALATHRSLVANTLQFRQWAAPWAEGGEVMAAALPLFHLFGLIVALSVGVTIGATLLLIADPRDAAALAAALAQHEVTLLPAVPVMLQALSRQATPDQLRSLRWVISGAAALPAPVQAAFAAVSGAGVVEGYGLTEAMVVTHCNPLQGERRAGSIGLPLPDVEAQIVSLDEMAALAPLPPDTLGELVVRGPALMTGYLARPEETALALRGGWLHTGDVGRMDADGYFYLVDRQKDVIKVGGLQVWPREVEDVLAALPQVAEAAVAGAPHPEYGEMVKAWVALKPGQTLSAEEVRAECQQKLAAYKAPREVAFVPRLPRSAAGKVLKRALK
jgi:long-chain acyl-CoA synthetase